jgi:hypothetical protein
VQPVSFLVLSSAHRCIAGRSRRVSADTGVKVPIIPGIMPIQNYASFRRLTNLCRCPVPDGLIDDLEPIKVRHAYQPGTTETS